MKVAAKLSTGFLLVVLLIWVAVFFAQNTYNRMQGEFAAVEEEIIPGVIAMSKMEILANQIAYETVAYINTGREENKQAVILAAEQLEALGQQYLAYEISEGPEEREMAEILVTGTDAFASSAVMLVRFRESGLVSDEVLLETRFSRRCYSYLKITKRPLWKSWLLPKPPPAVPIPPACIFFYWPPVWSRL